MVAWSESARMRREFAPLWLFLACRFAWGLVLLFATARTLAAVRFCERGKAALAAGRYSAAARDFQSSLRCRSDFAPAHNYLGEALLSSGRTLQAVAELREAIRLDPRLASAHFYLGEALAKQGRGEEAREAWRHVLSLEQPAWARLARERLGERD